ncbi:unnamed protein product [Schistosoma mattheei]|uniref:C2 domain-containing protein n=1 Tax=Schistosoma mattheei TaxID=31246 RepID=A0A183NWE1_9TREM|nr:unnamed protein product [Schistosoma mattheei]
MEYGQRLNPERAFQPIWNSFNTNSTEFVSRSKQLWDPGCTIPQGFVIDSLIGFIQELVMNDDPEHQWIEKIRTSRASNEARQRLFSRLSGELQRKMGLKVLNLGGNSLIGYQLHFDLEGETGVVVRGIGTAVRLKKYNPVTTPPNTPTGISKNSSHNWESPNASYKESGGYFFLNFHHLGVHNLQSHVPQALELGEFPFLTISQPLPGMILHFGSLVASKSVRLLDKNSPGIWFLSFLLLFIYQNNTCC